MDSVKSPGSLSSNDLISTEAEIEELRPSHHPVLTLGQLGNPAVPSTSLLWVVHTTTKSRLVEISPPSRG
jgi:hypothetical protein